MDKQAWVHKRKKRYMAVVLSDFEEHVQPLIPPDVAEAFKGIIRQKMHALALDACEVMTLAPGDELNGAAVDLRDQIGQPPRGVHA
jgi:hypothetical protein